MFQDARLGERLTRWMQTVEERLRMLIEGNYSTITITDDDENTRVVIGDQGDGTYGVRVYNASGTRTHDLT